MWILLKSNISNNCLSVCVRACVCDMIKMSNRQLTDDEERQKNRIAFLVFVDFFFFDFSPPVLM